jgi:hypothetical protein
VASASSIRTEWAGFTNARVSPPYNAVPSFVVILHDVPLSSFAHGGAPGPLSSLSSAAAYDYYIVIDAVSGAGIASFSTAAA